VSRAPEWPEGKCRRHQLAIAIRSIAADYDGMAIERAKQLQGDLRIELWCGSRRVADIPAEPKPFIDC
jgi:hypothetical protein